MQEEVEQKTVALVISTGKLTGRELKKAIVKLLVHLKDKKSHPNIPQGKQSVKQLAKQGQGKARAAKSVYLDPCFMVALLLFYKKILDTS